MLGIDGQWVASITIGEFKDFIKDTDDLIEFTVIEEAGNVLPTCILGFVTSKDGIEPMLNDGQVIEAKMGREYSEMKDIEISVSNFKSTKHGEDARYYEITGFASKIDYITDISSEISDKVSGVEAAIKAINKNFKLDSSLLKSKDKQNWIQYSITDKTFVNQCLLHCDLGKSFPLYAITADGRFILRDALKHVKQKSRLADWRFTRNKATSKDIVYEGDAMLTSDAGFINNWLGYGRTTLAYNMEKKIVEEVLISPETLLSLSSELDKAKSISDRFNGTRAQSENVHPKFWSSFYHNLQNLVNLGRIGMSFSVSDQYLDVNPLDIGNFSETSSDSFMSSEYHTGLYIVSKVVRTIAKNRMVNIIMLNREALNAIKNKV